jgi:hypothetical protein
MPTEEREAPNQAEALEATAAPGGRSEPAMAEGGRGKGRRKK